jgi:fatty-acyl-CoA synthase
MPIRASRYELTPIRFLERAGTAFATRVAVVDGPVEYTYSEWRARARRFARALRHAGVQRGDRIAFLAYNSEPLLLAHFAVPLAGAVLVAINTRLLPQEVGDILAHSGATMLFHSPEFGGIPGADLPLGAIALGPEFERLLQEQSDERVDLWLESEDDLIAIDYTSGTTGAPKGVMYDHRGAYLNALGLLIENRLTPDTRMLWTLPMFHCNGWSQTWALAAAGACSVCIPAIDTGRIWSMLDRVGITHFNAAPTVLIMLTSDPHAHRLEKVVRVCTGGAPPSPTLLSRMEELNFETVHLYGLTESYGPVTVNPSPPELASIPAPDRARIVARQGIPHVTAADVRVVTPEMVDVDFDSMQLGEVVLRGNTVTQGYYRQPDETIAAFDGGWFHTGDLAVVHPDGAIELRDRSKDMIISGGENISSIQIEQVLSTHVAILECAVVPKADPKWGEIPVAFVTLRPGMTASEDDVIAHCRARLAHYKCPRLVFFRDLPKTSTGKVQKHVLRQMVVERDQLATDDQ